MKKIVLAIYIVLIVLMLFGQKYIYYYNRGNAFFKNQKYDEAIIEYKKSLHGVIPKYKECKVRINYALAICKKVDLDLDESDENSVNQAIDMYKFAIDILTEKGCASKLKENEFHSEDAEILKEDIENEIDRLNKLFSQKQNSKENNGKESEKKEETQDTENTIKSIKENAIIEQKKIEKKYEDYGKNFDRNIKNW